MAQNALHKHTFAQTCEDPIEHDLPNPELTELFFFFLPGGRGRGRISYPAEGARGRFGGRGYGRANGQDTNDRDYNRSRGNGFYRQPRQERIFSGYQQGSRNGQNSSE